MRFFLLLVLSLAIFGFSAAQGYTPIQWDPNSQQLVSILNYGIAQATLAANSNGQLAGEWYWTDVTSVETEVTSTRTNYSFVVDIANYSRDTATIMVIVSVASDGTESLKNYAIM